ncbi:MAG TPA: sigma-70 family RNA polymerase sigma factor [Tepidimicrobium sp.]|nr:sigma-70 family RNA polymerase sigma factor [Tepidimicrobium sp.]
MYRDIERLLILAREGDKNAKERLLLKLKPLVLSSIRRYYNRKELYDDLIQEGYEVILKAMEDYDPDRGVYFLGYVKAMLKYRYIGKHRERQLYSLNLEVDDSGRELVDLIQGKEDPTSDVLDKEVREKLFCALGHLAPRQREVIIYFYIHDLSMREIAKRLGIAYRTVVNTKARAIEKLREKIVR